MQDNWQEFDRQIGQMLQDAEEKAPRRVWRAVSARLGQAAAAAAWWKWAAPAFALAAALLLGLFFTGTFNKTAPVTPGTDIIVAQNTPEESVPAEQIPEEEFTEEPVEQFMAPASRSTRKLTAQTVPASAEEDTIEPVATEPSINEEVTEPVTTPSGKQVSDEEAAENAAQWARIENEDVRKATTVKLSGLYAQSGLGGNDSNISYGGTGISRMAPGAGSEDAGISEASSSTYGVPFTVGLGARFHVAPKLSLGTGLEYSLLTRTFTGTYSNSYTGGIAHYVQYVGIPVNAYYDLFQTRDGLMNVYAWGGGTGEVCVSNNFRLMSAPGTTIKDKAGALQFSAAAGLGFEFQLSRNLGLYIDPAVRYYFHGNQPKSVRTDKPLMFTVNAGLRFSL